MNRQYQKLWGAICGKQGIQWIISSVRQITQVRVKTNTVWQFLSIMDFQFDFKDFKR